MWSRTINFCRFNWDLKRHSRISLNSTYFIKQNYSSVLNTLEELFHKHRDHELHKKIIYNEILIKKREKKSEFQIESVITEPIFMKFLAADNNTPIAENTEEQNEFFFPYEIKTNFLTQPTHDRAVIDTVPESVLERTPSESFEMGHSKWKLKRFKLDIKNLENSKKWNYLEEENSRQENLDLEIVNCDPSIAVSSVPCRGCGAFLHCQDISIPGFIPKEAFEYKTKQELEKEICQRCLFLREFDVALGVTVSSLEYPELLKQIKRKNCLAIIMIDLLDFPCSYWSEIMEIIGPSKPVVIVGNKIDLIPKDDSKFVRHVTKCLLSALADKGLNIKNVKQVSLISAKTGLGVNILINHLFNNWEYKGDVFIIGCTNAGKSTLFNTLIQSDYCSIKIEDILHRATVSAWPGTTLKLLKFPITKPFLWLTATRKGKMDNEQDRSFEQIPFQGLNKSLFIKDSKSRDMKSAPKAFSPENFDINKCRWCFDTPGVVNYDQIINILTSSELLLTLPKAKIIPRNFHMKPGMTLFIGGLARLDYVNGPDFAWFTVYASQELPVTVSKLEDADLLYDLLLGSPLFRVPMGGKNRLTKWPKLVAETLEITGKKIDEADVDIVLSSAGWVAVNAEVGYRCEITAWTPDGRGICVRNIPLIKAGHKIKGERIARTPAFRVAKEN